MFSSTSALLWDFWLLPSGFFKLCETGRIIPPSQLHLKTCFVPGTHSVLLSSSTWARPPVPPCVSPSWICTRTALPAATSWLSTAAGCPRGSPTRRWMRGCSQTSWSSCCSAPRWCSSRRAGARTWLFVTGKWKWVCLLFHGGHVYPASFSDPTVGFHLPVLWQDMLNCFASPFDVDEMLLPDHK